MARKRMISPSMWESESFSELSDLAKLVFISLFSHADDEGRGKASPAYIKSMTFPNDENRRVADIKSALSEIARCMSVQFYSADGRDYYVMTNWTEYQKIDKPTKSKLPPPPIVGEGGDIPNRQQFGEYSGSIRIAVDEDYTPKSSQVNISQDNRIEDCQTGGQTEKEYFLDLFHSRLQGAELETEYKARFENIVAELLRRESYTINKAEMQVLRENNIKPINDTMSFSGGGKPQLIIHSKDLSNCIFISDEDTKDKIDRKIQMQIEIAKKFERKGE